MPVVARLTRRVVERAPYAERHPYYLMEGGSPLSLRGFGLRVHRAQKQFVVRYRRRPYTLGRADILPLPEARERARTLLLELLRGETPQRRTNKTVSELAAAYLRRHAKPHKASRSAEDDERMWRKHVLPVLGGHKVHEIQVGHLQDLHVAMADGPFVANRVLSLLSKAFNLAELWGWRDRGTNPTRGIQRYPEPSRQRHLSADEYRHLGAAIRRARRERLLPASSIAAVELLLYTGCRPGEILALEWDWIDLEALQVRLPKAKGDRHSNGQRGRVVWLNKPALEVLQRLPRTPDFPYVLRGRQGRRLKSIRKTWTGLCRMAKIENATPYALRHSFVSEGVPAGVALELVSDLAGHGDIEITDRVYRSRLDDAQRAAASTMGEHLEGLTSGRQSTATTPS